MKNTCSQSGICQWCGEKIERFIKTQQWMLENTHITECEDSPTQQHILLGIVRRKDND